MSKHREEPTGSSIKDEQLQFDDSSETKLEARRNAPVTCLGITFDNDKARRDHFTEMLRQKLQDPEYRKIEGFPIGADEDILTLSDPPYYTACPNPWIAEFIEEWEARKPKLAEDYKYHREPFAADVSEGKNDPVYNARSYHTKVPHKAIMRYILHYTQPGDIVFDGFCGTGMTGVAAQMCGDREVVMSLGYQVKPDGIILKEEPDDDGKKVWRPFSKLGVRRAVLNDLSPAAAFIAFNYNNPIDLSAFEKEARRILMDVENDYGWMYETLHTDRKKIGKINYTVWSDVFICPDCGWEIVFWDSALCHSAKQVLDSFSCAGCGSILTKRGVERAWITKHDSLLNSIVRQAKQVPVLINYSVSGIGGTQRKKPDDKDLMLLQQIEASPVTCWVPISEIEKGDKTGEPLRIGLTHTHHFFTKRNLLTLSKLYEETRHLGGPFLDIVVNMLTRASKQSSLHVSNYFNGGGGVCKGHLNGTLYIPSLSPEIPATKIFSDRISTLSRGYRCLNLDGSFVLATQSLGGISARDDSIDFIFIDPPFGSNLQYSELNWNDEAWLRVVTNKTSEALENESQKKMSEEYRVIMTECFRNAYRILKPGHWMTVEFSNTKASVWNSIQTSLTEAGFIVANVAALDKKQGSFNAVNNPTSVKQDLAISAYKPNGGFEERFREEAQTEDGVWDFVRTHLRYLPVTKRQGMLMLFIPERDPRILFDQMVSYYVRRGYPVPISSQEFQVGLVQRFVERDGMFFLPDQVSEYDRKRMSSGELKQMTMFVSDEASAIQWLRQLLNEKPQAFSDINPQFMQQLGGWSKNEAQLDLRELLNQNFLCYDGNGPVPEQVHAYLSSNWKELRNLPKDAPNLIAKACDRWYVPDHNKAEQVEKMREKDLLREFESYKTRTKKFKNNDRFRIEAVRAGFKKAWQERDYATIVAVAEKIPNNVLEEDPKLLMWYDQAVTRLQGE
jgi:DNA modification methylase